MAWTYQATLIKRAPHEYKCSLELVKQALENHGYMFFAFRPPRAGEKYLSTASLSIVEAKLDFSVHLPRLIVVPATPTFDLDKEWNS